MIKGRATIQIIDEKSGRTVHEIHEENMITKFHREYYSVCREWNAV